MPGTVGETRAIKLDKPFHNHFENGQTDEYNMQADDVGDLLMITLMKSTGGFYSDWFVNKVAIAKNNVVYTFPCFRWVIKELVVFEGKGTEQSIYMLSKFEQCVRMQYHIFLNCIPEVFFMPPAFTGNFIHNKMPDIFI